MGRTAGHVPTAGGKTIQGYGSTYARHGAANLFAAMDVKSGTVLTLFTGRRRKTEFLEFMDETVLECPEGQDIQVIMDNFHISKKCDEWLAVHPVTTCGQLPGPGPRVILLSGAGRVLAASGKVGGTCGRWTSRPGGSLRTCWRLPARPGNPQVISRKRRGPPARCFRRFSAPTAALRSAAAPGIVRRKALRAREACRAKPPACRAEAAPYGARLRRSREGAAQAGPPILPSEPLSFRAFEARRRLPFTG